MKHVALLRGINVGGKRRLPMADLVAAFVGAGACEVRTYIQSGNVVFSSDAPSATVAEVERTIEAKFGFAVPMALRSAEELTRVVAANPFPDDSDRTFVGFLRDLPDADRSTRLDPDRGAPDAYRLVGREVFMRIDTSAATTKLTTAYFDSVLGTIMTVRNWRTTLALVELAQ